jgi:hypothetical protein
MAQIFPSDIEWDSEDRFENDELDTLMTLRDGLPDDYLIYHSVHWNKTDPRRITFGEVDFVIVNTAGEVMVIEQKNGDLHETEQGLEKHYRNGDKKLVFSQVQRNLENVRDKFKKLNPQSPKLTIDYLIYCPDHRVVDINAAGIDKVRTVDSQARSSLPERVDQLLATEKDDNPFLRQELHNFMLSSFRIAADVNAFKAKQRTVYRRLLDGLSEVIESLEFEPFRLRVIGTAGSGKTQVTLRFCERALAEGRKPLLVCYNRRLADKFTGQAPEGVTVDTYHGFCREMAERSGIELDFSKSEEPGFWRSIQDELLAATHSRLPKFDCLVIDEGQDFKSDWYEMLTFFLEEDATQLWLEDPLQKLRQTDPVPLPGFVTYRETGNFRTPRSIANFIKGTLESEFEQRNSLSGLGVALHEYDNPVDIQKILNSRALALVKQGFDPADIAIVSCRGIGSTSLGDLQQVAKWKLRRYLNKYDANARQVYSDGDINFDSIYRYKGEQAPVVILVDLDERLERNDWNTGVLYCAMTRATVRLELVVSKDCPWLETFRENLDEG